jgi:hypothetical protein
MLRGMKRTPKSLAVALAVALVLPLAYACGGGNDNLPPPPPPPPPPPQSLVATAAPAADDAGPPAPPPAPPVTLLPGTASPDPNPPLPTVKFVTPLKGQTLAADKASDFQVKLDVKSWQTATGSSHVHLILDNKPYKAIYDPKQPTRLGDLTNDPIGEGQHVLVAFPSRANHESVKTAGALAITEFFVGKSKEKPVDITKPLLIYSRPKGEYKGDFADHVLVDFQLLNDALADGKDHVHITVTGPGIDVSQPLLAESNKFGTPYYLDNVQNGAYTVKLELMSGDNKPVPGAWNSTTREIKIDHDAQSDAASSLPAASPTDAGTPPATTSKPTKK